MKHGLIAAMMLGLIAASLLLAPYAEQCCEYLGLLAPEGVSERPGYQHVKVEASRIDGGLPEDVPGARIGEVLAPFTLNDIHGKPFEVRFERHPHTVFCFVSSFCPTSKIYERRLNTLKDDFPGVQFIAVNADAMESPAELVEHFVTSTRENRLSWPVLKDWKAALATRLGARVCPDVFVFDRSGALVYRGGVDDNRVEAKVEQPYLRFVLEDLARAEAPRWRWQPPNGCCAIDADANEKTPEGARVFGPQPVAGKQP
jgi:thiol-disulfide isomerase/thioredoxin